jgi:hypothetical protein
MRLLFTWMWHYHLINPSTALRKAYEANTAALASKGAAPQEKPAGTEEKKEEEEAEADALLRSAVNAVARLPDLWEGRAWLHASRVRELMQRLVARESTGLTEAVEKFEKVWAAERQRQCNLASSAAAGMWQDVEESEPAAGEPEDKKRKLEKLPPNDGKLQLQGLSIEQQKAVALDLFGKASPEDHISMTKALAKLASLGIDKATCRAFFTLWMGMDEGKKGMTFTYIKFSLKDPAGLEQWMQSQLNQAGVADKAATVATPVEPSAALAAKTAKGDGRWLEG